MYLLLKLTSILKCFNNARNLWRKPIQWLLIMLVTCQKNILITKLILSNTRMVQMTLSIATFQGNLTCNLLLDSFPEWKMHFMTHHSSKKVSIYLITTIHLIKHLICQEVNTYLKHLYLHLPPTNNNKNLLVHNNRQLLAHKILILISQIVSINYSWISFRSLSMIDQSYLRC